MRKATRHCLSSGLLIGIAVGLFSATGSDALAGKYDPGASDTEIKIAPS